MASNLRKHFIKQGCFAPYLCIMYRALSRHQYTLPGHRVARSERDEGSRHSKAFTAVGGSPRSTISVGGGTGLAGQPFVSLCGDILYFSFLFIPGAVVNLLQVTPCRPYCRSSMLSASSWKGGSFLLFLCVRFLALGMRCCLHDVS